MASVTGTVRIVVADGRLKVTRSGLARWLGGSVNVPIDHVASVAAADRHEARRWWMGIRLAGIQIPGLMTAGLFRRDGEVSWWDVRRGRSAVIVTLRNEALARVVVEVDDPADTVRRLESALGLVVASGSSR